MYVREERDRSQPIGRRGPLYRCTFIVVIVRRIADRCELGYPKTGFKLSPPYPIGANELGRDPHMPSIVLSGTRYTSRWLTCRHLPSHHLLHTHTTMLARRSSCMRTMGPTCRRSRLTTLGSMHSQPLLSRTSRYGSVWWCSQEHGGSEYAC